MLEGNGGLMDSSVRPRCVCARALSLSLLERARTFSLAAGASVGVRCRPIACDRSLLPNSGGEIGVDEDEKNSND